MANSEYPPVRGKDFALYFEIPHEDGSKVLNPSGLTAKVVVNDRLAARDPVVRVLSTVTGTCVAFLTGALHTVGPMIHFVATSSSTGALPYTERIATSRQSLDRLSTRALRRREWGK